MRRRLPPVRECTECGRRFRGYGRACGCTENNGPGLADLSREGRIDRRVHLPADAQVSPVDRAPAFDEFPEGF